MIFAIIVDVKDIVGCKTQTSVWKWFVDNFSNISNKWRNVFCTSFYCNL